MALSTGPTMVAVQTPAVAEHQGWTGLAGVAEYMHFCLALQFFSKTSKNIF